MSKIYFDVLTEGEKKEFPKLANFRDIGVLAGGTALALQLNHRRSYDFDIFLSNPLPTSLIRKVKRIFGRIKIINQFEEEFTFLTATNIKITFIYYPFTPLFPRISADSIKLFHFKDIALDKTYTIGRRAQYRDYIDLFFLIKEKKLSLNWLIKNAQKKFSDLFPEKIFLEQLIYFEDLTPFPIEFTGEKYSAQDIKNFMEEIASDYLKKKKVI